MIELAQWFSRQPKQKRGILFLAFAGEELGLLGSAYYADHPELPLENAVAMINMDMIGRMRDEQDLHRRSRAPDRRFRSMLDDTKAPSTTSRWTFRRRPAGVRAITPRSRRSRSRCCSFSRGCTPTITSRAIPG